MKKTVKYCSNKNCSQVNPQPIENFHKNKSSKDGLQDYCKICLSKIARKHYYHDIELSRKRNRETYYRMNSMRILCALNNILNNLKELSSEKNEKEKVRNG